MLDPKLDRERRRPVWEAMSVLFLDIPQEEFHSKDIAERIAQAGYTDDEAKQILLNEVYPVVGFNLKLPVGEDLPFPIDWLEEKICERLHEDVQLNSLPSDFWMIEKPWNRAM